MDFARLCQALDLSNKFEVFDGLDDCSYRRPSVHVSSSDDTSNADPNAPRE